MNDYNIIIDSNENSIEAAIVDNLGVAELIVESKVNTSIIGNIYIGIVKNIIQDQFAFVDIGENRNGFLFIKDRKEESLFSKETNKLKVKIGSVVLVQVLKDQTNDKGYYLTTQISLSGKYSVLIKTDFDKKSVSVSKKIIDDKERLRLKNCVNNIIPVGYDIIIRTNADGLEDEQIINEVNQLLVKLIDISNKWIYQKAPALIFSEENVFIKILKNIYNGNLVKKIIINQSEDFEIIKNIISENFQDNTNKVELYNGDRHIFDYFDIKKDLVKAMHKKVWLNCGGYLYIEQTEACAVIDVNSGKFQGKKDQEKSVLTINLEAAVLIARQIRLRNLSGIIIVDFIDMKTQESKDLLVSSLNNEFLKDRISTNVIGLTTLGLMEITRKKTSEPLYYLLKGKKDVSS